MKKEKFFWAIIILLILINVAQLVGHRFGPMMKKDPRKKVVEHLDLNAEQEQKFFAFVKEHRQKARLIQVKQRSFTKAYFANTNEALLDSIASYEIEKIRLTEKHFADLKSILRKDQYANFESFKKQALQRIFNMGPKQAPRPKFNNRER